MPIWDSDALDDIENIIEHISKDDISVAWRIADEIFSRAAILDEHPKIGRKGTVKGTKEFILTGLPYILVYDPKEKPFIWRVLHGAQKWPP